ncbi:NifB/NifX family molybdenum-iron cluster-binding protein [Phosphitispora fastidiosa]|uniref:NifB/NifX family molybdenum-iron cluster-binding protein n=1 Tax=Phosphitispora fastidiosa TaxID=2837202 RepID=UPI001E61251A|nr:NifB/NifX family molybdenum-iron cluster-binding protein [Phosphitispora fastidiosa]MBU7005838.1 putative Fe-Mo cluster-binding NifX family protein [Phosphitispora fastidiosa]
MKIVISTEGKELDARVDPRFGRCEWFISVDSESMDFDCTANSAVNSSQGAGIQAAQFVVDNQAEALITGHVGPNAFEVLEASGIKIYDGTGLNAKQAIEELNSGKLSEITKAGQAHAGMNAGTGAGMNRGAGAGMRNGPRGRGHGQRRP